jgi:hypothetical protein
VKKVLSTAKRTPFSLQMAAMALISKILRVGLVGVSAQTTLVFALMASLTSSGSLKSTKVTSICYLSLRILLKYLWVPPYTSSMHKTWSPLLSNCMIDTVALMPLFNASANLAFSKEARFLSNESLVGLPHLA